MQSLSSAVALESRNIKTKAVSGNPIPISDQCRTSGALQRGVEVAYPGQCGAIRAADVVIRDVAKLITATEVYLPNLGRR